MQSTFLRYLTLVLSSPLRKMKVRFFYSFTCSEVLVECSKTLANLTVCSDGQEMVVEAGICAQLLPLLSHSNVEIIIACLQTLGSIASGNEADCIDKTGNDEQTQKLLQCGLLDCIQPLLIYHTNNKIRKEACWTLSNITGKRNQSLIVFSGKPQTSGSCFTSKLV